MSEKPAVPNPQYTWGEGLGTALALAQRCMAELRTLARTPGPEGKRGPVGEKGDRGEAGKAGPVGSPGKDGLDGKDGERGQKGERGVQGLEGTAGPPGPTGEKGDPGEAAYPGRACGLYSETETYRAMDVVACNGSEWRAVRDDPGPLPGDGWVLGAKGVKGKPGDRGERGPRGPEGRGIVDVSVAEDGQTLMIKFSDGVQRSIPLVTR